MKRKMVIVKQRDAKDCGPCALSSIIQYYEGYVSIEKIREHAYTSKEGTTVYHLMNAAKKYGFDAIAKKYLDNQIPANSLPSIVHIQYENGLAHYMVLYKIKKDNVVLMDPASGKKIMNIKDFLHIFTGVTIELSPKHQIIKLEKESGIYNLFIEIIKRNKVLFRKLICCSAVVTTFTIISGFYFKVCYEYIQNSSYYNSLKYIIYLFLIVYVLKLLVCYFQKYYENHLNKNIDIDIFSSFINHIFHLPLKVINTRSVGEIMTRISELTNVKDLFSKLFISCFLELILSIGTIILLFNINVSLSSFLVALIVAYILLALFYSPYLYKRIMQNIDYNTNLNSTLLDNINMLSSIKSLNKIDYALEKIEKEYCLLAYDNYSFTNSYNIFSFFQDFIYELGIFIINTYGFYLIFHNSFSLVDLVVFNSLLSFFVEPIKKIVSLIPNFNFLRASFRKICDFIDLEEEKMGELENFVNGDICFKNVEFSYNDYSKIIDDLNLTIKQGEKVMLKGGSGCGKSTLCQLLQRVYNPSKGSITINSKNILDYSIQTIRNNITYVGQKEFLYSDTIKNNIVFGNENLNFDEVCRICIIEPIVNKKQFRFDFGIDNNFGNISGGEKQRIVLARALLNSKNILVLDEALSEVDYQTERKIIKNLLKAYPQKTIIYITHKKQDNLFEKIIDMEKNAT